MAKSLDGLVEEIRAKRSEKLPQSQGRLETLKAAKQAVLDARVKATAVAGSNVELQAKLQEIDFSKSLSFLDEAILSNENAVNRLKRASISIGVAGKSGQGKSQILQMLTGLTDLQIPTGGGAACTAARSIVHNGAECFARVHYLTKYGILEKKVYPSYAAKGANDFALGLEPLYRRPASLEEFISMNLPSVGTQDDTPTTAEDNWQKVIALQQVLRNCPNLREKLEVGIETVDISLVRDYIVKDNGETLHNVVDYVEIATPFPIGLPEGLTVYDLPGLSDPSPGIQEDMFSSLKNDADIVFFMRKAETDGDRAFWKDEDNKAIDLMKRVYPVEEVKPADWIQLVLNLDTRVGHLNSKNTESLRTTVTRGFVPAVCDCGSSEAVRKMVDDNIGRLVENVARIDNLRIAKADESYKVALSSVRSVADAFAAAIGQTIALSNGFDAKKHREVFWGDLRAPFKRSVEEQLAGIEDDLRAALKTSFSSAYAKMKHIYEAYESSPDTEFPAEFPVISKSRLVTLLRGNRGMKETIDQAARNQVSAVVGLLRNELSGCCENLRNIYLNNVEESVTRGNAAIQALLGSDPKQQVMTPEEVFKSLRNRLEEGSDSMETIASALDNLLHFDVSYETQLLPYLFDEPELVDKFDPNSSRSELGDLEKYLIDELNGDFDSQADVLFNALKNYSLNWIAPLANSRSEGPCRELCAGIMRVVKANYRNFIAMFVWGEQTEDEWDRYLVDNAATLWPGDFEKAASQSQLGRELRDIVTRLRKVAS